MGRPAVNTALNNTFNADAPSQGTAKDNYNKDSTQATWAATYTAETSKNLAILDSLDGVCANQFLASDAGAPNVAVYGGLGGVLADDRLWLDANGTKCDTYLGVEAQATGKILNTDCGGRHPKYDVIDVTYSAAAYGDLSSLTDGIAADPVKTAATAFPYLAAPQ
jgi:hypothetical protein